MNIVLQAPLIIAIDDSPTVCKIIEIVLCREGYTVLSFPDGIDALRWLTSPTAQGSNPALILLDKEMPKMNGYEVARYLKSKPAFTKTPIVMISHCDNIVDRLKARLVGATSYLGKPFTAQQLLQTVVHHLGPSPSSSR